MGNINLNKQDSLKITSDTTIEDLLGVNTIRESVLKIVGEYDILSESTDYKEQINLILLDNERLARFMYILSNMFGNFNSRTRLVVGEVFQKVRDSIFKGEKYNIDIVGDVLRKKVIDVLGDIDIEDSAIEHFSLGLPYQIDNNGVINNVEVISNISWQYKGDTYYLVHLTSKDEGNKVNYVGNTYINPEKGLLMLGGLGSPISQIEKINISGYDHLNSIKLLGVDAYNFVADEDFKPVIIDDKFLQLIEPIIVYNGGAYSRITFLDIESNQKVTYFCNEKYKPLKIEGFNQNVIDLVQVNIKGLGLVYQITFDDGSQCLTKSNGEVYSVGGELVQGIREFDVHDKLGDEDGKIGSAFLYTIFFKSGKTHIVDENMTVLRDSNIFNILSGEKVQDDKEKEKYDLSNVELIREDVEVDLENDDIIYNSLKFTKYGDDLLVQYYKGIFTGYGKKIGDPYDTIGGFHNILDEKFLVIDKAEGGQILLNSEYKTLSYKGGVVNSIVYGEGIEEFAVVEAGDDQVGVNKNGYIKIAFNDGTEVDTVPIKELYFT